jgi:hypothetical protein
MFGFTYNLTNVNTITIVKATKETPIEWTFKNLNEVITDFKKNGFTVITNID